MPAESKFSAPDPREVDPRTVRRAFTRAVSTYDEAAVLEREVGSRMAQRLDYITLAPMVVLDAGCGTGEAIGELAARYPAARIVGLDAALAMTTAALLRTAANALDVSAPRRAVDAPDRWRRAGRSSAPMSMHCRFAVSPST
jgi:cyclopropane fatty-acyl-phospholipid synthase-like methyltransferase